MKNIHFFLLGICLFILMGASCESHPGKRPDAQKAVTVAGKVVDSKKQEIISKGIAYVYAAGNALSKVPETNKAPEVVVGSRFIELAKLTLGPPSIEDAMKMDAIVDGLLKESKEAAALAQARAAESELLAETYKKEAEVFRQQRIKAEKSLADFNGKVIILEKERGDLTKELQDRVEKLQNINDGIAAKADKWDEENSFWNSINPFYDLGKFFKKISVWALIIGLLFMIAKFGGVIFPALSGVTGVVDWFLGLVGKLVFRVSPSAKKSAGVVGDSVFSALEATVNGLEKSLDKIKNHPIEEDVLRFCPRTKMYNFNEVRDVLEQHSENILSIIKADLKEYHTFENRSVIKSVKNREDSIKM